MSNGGAAQAFIAFLRCEAAQAEGRAKSLRATAAAIESNNLGGTKRKRKIYNGKKKTQHTAYSVFVTENIEQFKKSHPDLPHKEIVGIMTRQWSDTMEEEKNLWAVRADQLNQEEHDLLDGHKKKAGKKVDTKDSVEV